MLGVHKDAPPWMVEFDRLLANAVRDADAAPFTAAGNDAESMYTGRYRGADQVTLTELTGLDPAVFGR